MDELNRIEFPKLITQSPYIRQYSQNDSKPTYHFSSLT